MRAVRLGQARRILSDAAMPENHCARTKARGLFYNLTVVVVEQIEPACAAGVQFT
jgi:hypothetical protein